MTNANETQPAAPEQLDDVSLDLVVGGSDSTSDIRKQEQEDKLSAGRK